MPHIDFKGLVAGVLTGFFIGTGTTVAGIYAFEQNIPVTVSIPGFAAAFEAKPTSGAAPLTVNFMDRSIGNLSSWLWDFGDGTSSNERDPSHTYGAGVYTVSLTVTDITGKKDTETKIGYILASAPPAVNTDGATNISTTKVTLNSTLTSLGTATMVNLSFQWGTSPGSYLNETTPQLMTQAGTFAFDLVDLTPATTYYFRAKADGGIHGLSYGEEKSFATSGSPYRTVTATGTGTAIFCSDLGNLANLTAVAESSVPKDGKPVGVTFPHGLFSFDVTNIAVGSTVNITMTYPSALPTGTQYWIYKTGAGWFQIPVSDDDGDNVITISLTDGGFGDGDGVANGSIVDPGGPAIPPQPVPPPPVPVPSQPKATTSAPPVLSVQYLRVEPSQAYPNNPVRITLNVVNSGGTAGSYTVDLVINGYSEGKQTVTVPPASAVPVSFTVYKAQPGTYTVEVGGQQTSFRILSPSASAGRSTSNAGTMIALVAIGVLLVVGIVILFTRLV